MRAGLLNSSSVSHQRGTTGGPGAVVVRADDRTVQFERTRPESFRGDDRHARPVASVIQRLASQALGLVAEAVPVQHLRDRRQRHAHVESLGGQPEQCRRRVGLRGAVAAADERVEVPRVPGRRARLPVVAVSAVLPVGLVLAPQPRPCPADPRDPSDRASRDRRARLAGRTRRAARTGRLHILSPRLCFQQVGGRSLIRETEAFRASGAAAVGPRAPLAGRPGFPG